MINYSMKKLVKIDLLFGIIIGLGLFFYLYGYEFLNPANTTWLMSFIGGSDYFSQFLGINAYVFEQWHWPPFLYSSRSWPSFQSVMNTDSLAFLAIIFKIFRGLLPYPFQFWGIWWLINCIMLGVMATLVMRQITDKILYKFLGTLILIISPVMLFCSLWLSLSSHWILLYAIWVLQYKQNLKFKVQHWSIVLVSSILIHPYFFGMTLVLFFADIIQMYSDNSLNKRKLIIILSTVIAEILCVVYLLGAFSIKMDSTSSGYGNLSMNLNALINPYVDGYSKYIQAMPGANSGQLEGFNYLGLGIILLGIIYSKKLYIKLFNSEWQRKHWFLLLGCVGLSLFALSDHIMLGSFNIVSIMLPSELKSLFSVFRASGRMFWPVYYLIVIFILKIAFNDKRKIAVLIIAICSIIQILDIGGGILDIKWEQFYRLRHFSYKEKLADERWRDFPKKYKHIEVFSLENWSEIGWYALKNKMTVNNSFFCRSSNAHQQHLDIMKQNFINGKIMTDTIYIIDSSTHELVNQAAGVIYKLDGIKVFVPAINNN